MSTITLDKTLDMIEKLPYEQQETLVEVVRKRLIERRRAEIAKNGRRTLKAFKEGKAKVGSVADLRKDMES